MSSQMGKNTFHFSLSCSLLLSCFGPGVPADGLCCSSEDKALTEYILVFSERRLEKYFWPLGGHPPKCGRCTLSNCEKK